jgi:hypothetical protein
MWVIPFRGDTLRGSIRVLTQASTEVAKQVSQDTVHQVYCRLSARITSPVLDQVKCKVRQADLRGVNVDWDGVCAQLQTQLKESL